MVFDCFEPNVRSQSSKVVNTTAVIENTSGLFQISSGVLYFSAGKDWELQTKKKRTN